MVSDNICIGFVEGIKCGKLLAYDGKKMGTLTMNRHMKQACHGRKDDSQPSVSSFVTSPSIHLRAGASPHREMHELCFANRHKAI